MAEWTMSDAWVFSSIGDGFTLARIVAVGDGINHAILTEAEFTRAVPRLLAAGLVGADAPTDRYWHTDAGRALCEPWTKRGGLFSWIEVVPPALRRLGEPQDSDWSLPAGAFDRAVQEYLGSRQGAYRLR